MKLTLFKYFIPLCISFNLLSITKSDVSPDHFFYKNKGRDWSGYCSTGLKQSPINIIDGKNTVPDDCTAFFDYKLPSDASQSKLKYNGNSLNLDVNLGKLTFRNDENTVEEYIANKIQFHLPSEHYVTVDGQTPRYPVEIQIYHDIISTTNSIVTNQYMKVKRAVVSILFEEGEVEDGDMFFNSLGISKYNLNKDRQFNIPKVNGSDEVEIERQAVSPATYGPGFNILAFQGLLNLISADPSMYFYYGSDTTPPCEEDVLWMVFQKPRTLSRTQFNFLKQLLVKHVDKNKKINEATSRFDLFGNNRGVFIFDHIIRGGLIRSNPMGLLGVTNQNFYDTQSEEQ